MFLHSKQQNNISFTEDIIKEVAKRTGKDEKLIEEIYKTNLKYIHEEIKKDDSIIIVNFPNLGKMRFNYYLGLCYLNSLSKSTHRAEIRRRTNTLKKILDENKGNELKNFNFPIVYTGVLNLKNTRNNAIKEFYKNWGILEEKHNENHAKYFKKS